jgi:hypothetical protein
MLGACVTPSFASGLAEPLLLHPVGGLVNCHGCSLALETDLIVGIERSTKRQDAGDIQQTFQMVEEVCCTYLSI